MIRFSRRNVVSPWLLKQYPLLKQDGSGHRQLTEKHHITKQQAATTNLRESQILGHRTQDEDEQTSMIVVN